MWASYRTTRQVATAYPVAEALSLGIAGNAMPAHHLTSSYVPVGSEGGTVSAAALDRGSPYQLVRIWCEPSAATGYGLLPAGLRVIVP